MKVWQTLGNESVFDNGKKQGPNDGDDRVFELPGAPLLLDETPKEHAVLEHVIESRVPAVHSGT